MCILFSRQTLDHPDRWYSDVKNLRCEYFPEISKICYEGPGCKNPLAFRHYNAEDIVEGKSMSDWLRYSVCYWHSVCYLCDVRRWFVS